MITMMSAVRAESATRQLRYDRALRFAFPEPILPSADYVRTECSPVVTEATLSQTQKVSPLRDAGCTELHTCGELDAPRFVENTRIG